MSESADGGPAGRQEPAGGPAADDVWEGPDRLRWLEDVDGIDLPAVDGLVEGLVQVQKSIAGLHALEASMLSAAVDVLVQAMTVRAVGTDQNLPWRELSAEIAAALGVSDRTMQARLGDAATLVRGFTAVHAALREGRVDRGRARTIVDVGSTLPPGLVREEYEAAALRQAEHLTAGRLGAACRLIADRLDPESIDERHARARRRRRVGVVDLDDGMARLFADLPATLARAIFDRLTQMAKTVQHAPDADGDARPDGAASGAGPAAGVRDPRTLDQIRTDVFADVLLTAVPDGHGPADVFEKIAAHVQVLIPAQTLNPALDIPAPKCVDGDPYACTHTRGDGDPLAAADVPSEPGGGVGSVSSAVLTGAGPIDTATARILAGAAGSWDRVFTDPYSGGVLCVDRHDPSKHLKRLLKARDEHCRFPGCRQPARRCEIDHTIRYRDGGPTCHCNLEHLCKGHHVLKHHTRWRVRQLPRGILKWTSPTGRTYTDFPPPTVRFIDTTSDPPPF